MKLILSTLVSSPSYHNRSAWFRSVWWSGQDIGIWISRSNGYISALCWNFDIARSRVNDDFDAQCRVTSWCWHRVTSIGLLQNQPGVS